MQFAPIPSEIQALSLAPVSLRHSSFQNAVGLRLKIENRERYGGMHGIYSPSGAFKRYAYIFFNIE